MGSFSFTRWDTSKISSNEPSCSRATTEKNNPDTLPTDTRMKASGLLGRATRSGQVDGRSELFHGLSEKQTKAILSLGKRRREERGNFFFQQGDPTEGLYLLESGHAKVFHVTDEGKQTVLGFVGPGRIFGVSALLSAPHYFASAEAVAPTEAVFWKRDVLKRVLREHGRFSFNMLMLTAYHLSKLRERYVYLTTQRVERRIAWALTTLGRQIGKQKNGVYVIPEGFSGEDLADMAGTTKYTLSRVLGGWERKGWLTKSRGRIVVQRPESLTKFRDDIE
ncbi:MAG TPA: Crp/Fnr family transcriptional regulator [Terriglobales bacterium]|nr:Crp/Fnr family transcriptional regulator [Terriglobales bacterium]